MPYKAIRTLLDSETQATASGTKVVKLPLSNVLHTLWVKCEATTGTGPTATRKIDQVLEKIEVIGNGSEVLVSLTPELIRELIKAKYDYSIQETSSSAANTTVEGIYPIPFGHNFWDPNLYLPCDRFTDLELRITFDLGDDAAEWDLDSFTVTVIAYMTMEGSPGAYNGTLRHTVTYDWTTAASGDEVITLPRRLSWHGLMLYVYSSSGGVPYHIERVKLSINNDQLIPLNIEPSDLQDILKKQSSFTYAIWLDLKEWVNGGPFVPTNYDIVQLVVTQKASGGDAKVVLEELLTVG